MYFLRQKKILTNVCIMAFLWMAGSFNYYLIQFLINTFQAIYITGIVSSISDIVANSIAAYVFEKIGVRKCISGSQALATIGGLLVLTYGLQHDQSWTFPLLVMMSKFGVTFTFNTLYVSHATLFPVLFASSAMGINQFVARLFSAISPLLAQVEEPVPMIVFTSITTTSFILAFFIQAEDR